MNECKCKTERAGAAKLTQKMGKAIGDAHYDDGLSWPTIIVFLEYSKKTVMDWMKKVAARQAAATPKRSHNAKAKKSRK